MKPRSNCPITQTLDIIGDRWTLVVLRDIVLGGKTSFGEFAKSEGISSSTLAERLERLEKAGILVRQPAPEDGRKRVWRPTEKALDLLPILLSLSCWGIKHTRGTAHKEMADAYQSDPEGTLARLRARAQPWIVSGDE